MNKKLRGLVLFIFTAIFIFFVHAPPHQTATNITDPIKVMPGGQSIGIMVHSEGVVVAGLCPVTDRAGREYSPALKAGMRTGDIILKINGYEIESDLHAKELIAKSGFESKEAVFDIMRNKEPKTIRVNPVLCADTGSYRVGLYIRDGAAGVGTLTFYEPRTMIYGALGHVIADTETSKSINLAHGCIVSAVIRAVHPGQRGQPGEKIGLFESKGDSIGNIESNTFCGIFGRLENNIFNPIYPEPIPVVMNGEVEEGPAEILTVLEDNKIERFDVEIQRVNSLLKTNGKDLVIKINDEKLLEKTGGIIQGMSGSPIIQNKKLVGAVTHVFINDPQRGYGVMAERMLKESGIILKSTYGVPGAYKPGTFLLNKIILAGDFWFL